MAEAIMEEVDNRNPGNPRAGDTEGATMNGIHHLQETGAAQAVVCLAAVLIQEDLLT
jgi:hypothetical protein